VPAEGEGEERREEGRAMFEFKQNAGNLNA